MTGFASSDSRDQGSPRFRLVERVPAQAAESPKAPLQHGFLVPRKLLVPLDEWEERRPHGTPVDRVHAVAEVPLIAALARIRSDADAALALAGVLELLARRFHITLAVGSDGGGTFHFEAPESCDLSMIAGTIDDSLLGIVRSTDLQGALREQMMSRVERVDG